jgi:hypothetical protein
MDDSPIHFPSPNSINNSLFRPQTIRRVLILLAIFHFFLLMCYSLPKRLLRTDKNRDVFAYYLVSKRIQKGEPVYWPLHQTGPHEPSPHLYLYPPVFSSLLVFIPSKSFVIFAQIWTIFLYFMFWIYAACLTRLASGKLTLPGTLIAGLVLTIFPGTHAALSLGNADPFLWALFGMALVIPTLRGSGLMAISLVKPWAVWPLIWSFSEGKKVLIGALLVAFGGAGLGMLVMGPTKFYSNCSIWIREVLPSLSQGSWSVGSWGNWSISFAALRVLKALDFWNYQSGVLPLWAKSWLLFAGISAPLFSGWLLRRRSKVLQLSVMGCTAVLFAPTCWTYYLPLALSLFAVLIGQVLASPEKMLKE